MILTRRIDQGVRLYDADGLYIGHITVCGVDRDRAKLGFDVDPRFVVLRDELLAPPSSTPVGDVSTNHDPAAIAE